MSDRIEHARRRPGMYIGSTGPVGLTHLLLEVVSNSVDQAIAGRVREIEVTVHADQSVSIVDDGPGMGGGGAEGPGPFIARVLGTAHVTPTADGHHPHVHVTSGIGLVPVSALSEWFEIRATTSDEVVVHRRERGREVAHTVRRNDGAASGTAVRLRPDPEIFSLLRWDLGGVQTELVRLAHLIPELTIRFAVEPQVYGPFPDLRTLFDERFTGRGDHLDGPFMISADRGDDRVGLVLGWRGRSWPPQLSSYCNLRPTDDGGSHVQGMDEGLRRVFGPGPTDELMGGLDAVLSVMLLDPAYSGPTKGRLDSPEATALVADAIAEQLPAHLARRPELDAMLRSRVVPRR